MNRYGCITRGSVNWFGATFAVALVACIGANANAAWTTDVSGTVDSRYDDNVRLSTNGEEDSAVATNVGGELHVRRVTESSEIMTTLGASYLMYSAYDGQQDLDDEDIQYAEVRARARQERLTWGLVSTVRRDVLLRTVGNIIDPLAPGTPDAPSPPTTDNGGVDAGSTEEQVRRTRTWLAPYVSYDLTERSSLQLGYTFLGLDYDEQSSSGVNSSQSNSVNASLLNKFSERDTGRSTLRAGRFSPAHQSEDTDAYEASVGWEHAFTNTTTANVEVGAQRSERDSDSYTGYVARVFATRRAEASAFRARLEHSLQAGSYGELVKSDTFDLRYRRSLSDRLVLDIVGRAYKTSNSSNQTSNQNNDRKYADVGPEITYAVTQSISVGLLYRYRWVDRQNEGSGTSNAVGITLSYQPQRQF